MINKRGDKKLKAIKYFREAAGMTQMELAEKMNVSQSTVGMWEIGINKPRTEKLIQLAKLFNCTIEELLKD